MAEEKHGNIFILLLLGVGGYFVYKWWQDKNAGTGNVVQLGPPSTLTNPVNVPTSGTMAVPPLTNTTGPLPVTTQNAVAAGIDPTVYGVVNKWAQTDGRPPVIAMAAAGIPAEYQGMYDIITNFWDQNIPPGTVQVAFWDALRTKYDPTHIYW